MPPVSVLESPIVDLRPLNQQKQLQASQNTSNLFDIDSLNAIKKANDLATKKVEITNQVFEMLVHEITDSLFPQRDDTQFGEADMEGSAQKKKKTRRSSAQRGVKKSTVMPKIKEIIDGVPVDMCLKRIQIQATMRQSVASGDQGSLSATQSLSVSKDLTSGGLSSYLDQTKSKEQLEASSQFQQIELRKQEQLDLL